MKQNMQLTWLKFLNDFVLNLKLRFKSRSNLKDSELLSKFQRDLEKLASKNLTLKTKEITLTSKLKTFGIFDLNFEDLNRKSYQFRITSECVRYSDKKTYSFILERTINLMIKKFK